MIFYFFSLFSLEKMKPPDDELKDSFKSVKMTLNTICSNDLLKKRIKEFVLNANNRQRLKWI